MSVKPFTLNYFILSALGKDPSGLDLVGLKNRLLESSDDDLKVIKDGSLYGTISKLKSFGCVQTSTDIDIDENGNDVPTRRYLITTKGKASLYPAIKLLQSEEIRAREIDFSGIAISG